jgi:hypothetical protein
MQQFKTAQHSSEELCYATIRKSLAHHEEARRGDGGSPAAALEEKKITSERQPRRSLKNLSCGREDSIRYCFMLL